jgi:hypothetical protein
VLWGVLWVVPEVRTQQLRLGTSIPLPWGGSFEPALDVAVLVVAWSVSEFIRYTFYFCKARSLCKPSANRRARWRADADSSRRSAATSRASCSGCATAAS